MATVAALCAIVSVLVMALAVGPLDAATIGAALLVSVPAAVAAGRFIGQRCGQAQDDAPNDFGEDVAERDEPAGNNRGG